MRRVAVGTLIAGFLCLGLTGTSVGADTVAPLQLTFDSDPTDGDVFLAITNSGSTALAVDVASLNGGVVRPALNGTTPVADLPDYDGTTTAPRAVIRVLDADGTDDLSPGAAPFEFGADFRLDQLSTGGTLVDDGNNLMQRGLAGAPSQFKLEVDGSRVRCRVKGSAGFKTAVSTVPVTALQWYGARCTRADNTVRVTVTTYLDDGSTPTVSNTVSSSIGELAFPAGTALSVGGKLQPNGLVHNSTDQFNGHVDNAFLSIDSVPVDTEAGVTLAGAGDLCGGCAGTANRVRAIDPDVVVTMGDNAYSNGLLSEFVQKYGGGTDPQTRWGRPSIKDITLPGYGNHDCYDVPRATGATKQACDDAVAYFGPDSSFGTDIAGTPGSYHTVVGEWLLVHLNSAGNQGSGEATAAEVDEQDAALAEVLAADDRACEVVVWHHPRYSGGEHENNPFVDPWFKTAHSHGVEVVLNGHDHDYERFAPMDGDGAAAVDGTRQFVVGTGGARPKPFDVVQPHSEVRIVDKGVLSMQLRDDESYTWEFLDDVTGAVDDAGSGTCRP